jgi:hypothetical protein
VRALSRESAAATTFILFNATPSAAAAAAAGGGEGHEVSIARYFKTSYGLDLQHPELPCVEVGQIRQLNGQKQPLYYPLELCR